MRNAMSHLSLQQVEAITSISYDLQRRYGCNHLRYETSNVVKHGVQVFPHLRRIEIRLLRGRRASKDMHCNYAPITHEDVRKDAVRKYVPHWFSRVVTEDMLAIHGFEYQDRQRWDIEWPQLKSDAYLKNLDERDQQGNPRVVPYMSRDAVGIVKGVQMCPCDCGSVAWTCADLIQETGRKVEIDTVYYGPEDRVCTDPELESRNKGAVGCQDHCSARGRTTLRSGTKRTSH
jgi:hypothetical protein